MAGYFVDDAFNFLIGEGVRERAKAARDAIIDKLPNGPDQNSLPFWDPRRYATPEEAKANLINMDPKYREMQLQAIQALRDKADGTASSQEDAARFQAVQEANDLAKSREAGVISNAQARGVGGGGMEFALRAQAGQDAANRAGDMTMKGAADAALQRLAAQGAYTQGVTNMRGQEQQMASQNADILNQFNMYNTGMKNRVNMSNTDMLNQSNLDRVNRTEARGQRGFNNSLSKWDRSSNIEMGDVRDVYDQGKQIQGMNEGFWNVVRQAVAGGMGGSGGGGNMGGFNMGQIMGSQGGGAGGGGGVPAGMGGYNNVSTPMNMNLGAQMPDYQDDAWLYQRR